MMLLAVALAVQPSFSTSMSRLPRLLLLWTGSRLMDALFALRCLSALAQSRLLHAQLPSPIALRMYTRFAQKRIPANPLAANQRRISPSPPLRKRLPPVPLVDVDRPVDAERVVAVVTHAQRRRLSRNWMLRWPTTSLEVRPATLPVALRSPRLPPAVTLPWTMRCSKRHLYRHFSQHPHYSVMI